MPWIESHSVLVDHKKVRESATLLQIKSVHFLGHLHCLWHKVIELAEDGDITSWSETDIAYYARWDGDAKIFYETLKSRFIDEKNGKKLIHDWLDYAGKYLHRKYSTNNPKRLQDIKKKYKKAVYTKRCTKEYATVYTKLHLPNQPNQPNQPKETPPTPSKKEGEVSFETDFEKFWQAYPRKVNEERARKAWKKLKPSEELVTKILSTLETFKRSKDWQKDKGTFVPYPATWLNEKRWKDIPDSVELSPAVRETVVVLGRQGLMPTEQQLKQVEALLKDGCLSGDFRGGSVVVAVETALKRKKQRQSVPISAPEVKSLVAQVTTKKTVRCFKAENCTNPKKADCGAPWCAPKCRFRGVVKSVLETVPP